MSTFYSILSRPTQVSDRAVKHQVIYTNKYFPGMTIPHMPRWECNILDNKSGFPFLMWTERTSVVKQLRRPTFSTTGNSEETATNICLSKGIQPQTLNTPYKNKQLRQTHVRTNTSHHVPIPLSGERTSTLGDGQPVMHVLLIMIKNNIITIMDTNKLPTHANTVLRHSSNSLWTAVNNCGAGIENGRFKVTLDNNFKSLKCCVSKVKKPLVKSIKHI